MVSTFNRDALGVAPTIDGGRSVVSHDHGISGQPEAGQSGDVVPWLQTLVNANGFDWLARGHAAEMVETVDWESPDQASEMKDADTTADSSIMPSAITAPTENTEQDVASPAPQYAIDALQAGYQWGGAPVVIKYSFLDSLPGYYSSSSQEASNFSTFNAMQEAAVRDVLDQLSSFANVTFVETSDAQAWMTFGNTSLGSGIAGWAYYPYHSGSGS